MTISELQAMRGSAIGITDIGRPLPSPRTSGSDEGAGVSFGETLQQAIGEVDASQKAADSQINAFVAGEQENVHEVMIAMNEAKLSFQLMTEVRNKMLEAYQELMRMQV